MTKNAATRGWPVKTGDHDCLGERKGGERWAARRIAPPWIGPSRKKRENPSRTVTIIGNRSLPIAI
jgi:hypothetical protein